MASSGSSSSPPRPSSGRRGTQPQVFFSGPPPTQTWGGRGSGSSAGLAMSGSLSASLAAGGAAGPGSGSVASPLQYNSPTKRFGYTRWPPLISPTPPDPYPAPYTHHHPQDAHAQAGYPDDGYADVRLEVERSGHNLTSVMMDPRAPGGVSHELEAALLEQPMPSTPLPSPATSAGAGLSSSLSGSASLSAFGSDVEDVRELVRRAGPLLQRYRQNHHAPPEARGYRPEIFAARKATDGAADLAECFRQVPPIFFSRDFELADPAMFEALVVKATPDSQEKLGQYLDVVETCLLKQIASRSQHFFEALTTLQDVRDRVAQACQQVHRLRTGLHDIDRKTVMGMIRIPRLAQRKVNLATLLEKLRLMQDAQRAKELAQSLLTAGDYMGALDVLEDGRALMRDGNLQSVHALRRLHRQLGEYLELVSDLMGTSFVNLAAQLEDPDEAEPASPLTPVIPSPSTSSLASPNNPARPPPPASQLSESVVAQLIPRVRGLVRLCRLSKVMERYRGRLTDTLKGVVKTVLLEYLDMADYQQPQGQDLLGEEGDAGALDGSNGGVKAASPSASTNALTAKVKAMPAGDFLDCLRLCFEQLLLPMERAALVHAFLEEQISVELSRLLDRRASRSASGAGASPSATSEPISPSLPLSPAGGAGAAGAGAGVAVPVPPSSPPPRGPSKSDKFKSFLDKRRMETQGQAAALTHQAGGGGVGGGGGGVGGGGGRGGMMRDEEQIKVLELQACKRLNDEILKTLCDLSQRHVASLLVARKEAHMRLTLGEMKTLWDATTTFIAAMERISGTAGFGLKSTLLTQAKLFVEHLHEANMAALLAALESERWAQADVTPAGQAQIDRLVAGRALLAAVDAGNPFSSREELEGSEAAAAAASRRSSLTSSDGAGGMEANGGGGSRRGSKAGKAEPAEAVVGEEGGRYKMVWSALLLLGMLMESLNVAANFPSLAMDVMQRVVDLLRLFNARTTQLVLGAGAIQAAAKLRSITAKHLALASQSLGLVIVLLPHVRAALASRLQPKQQAFLVELDRIKQEYQEHHEKILAKFVAMIGELLAHSATQSGVRERDWDDMAGGACRFVEDVIKGVSTMHRVLYQLLPPAQVQDVFSRIFDLLAHRLREYLEEAPSQPKTTAGRQRLVDEISHLATSLSLLRGVNSDALAGLEAHFKRQQQLQEGKAAATSAVAAQGPPPPTAAASPSGPAPSPSSS